MKTVSRFPKTEAFVWLIALLSAALIAACGGSSSGYGNGGNGATGTLGVSLTDDPACGFDKVNVTVSKVRVHQSSTATDTDSGWNDITLDVPQTIDLLGLNNGAFYTFGVIPLPAGHYTQVRLVLDPNANSVVMSGGTTEIPLVTPSAVQSGIKLINPFDVVAGQRADLMLDFNACQSIVRRGNGTYALKPVVRMIPFAVNGIDGFVDTGLLNSNVLVTAQQNGVIVRSTAPNASTGEFFLGRMAPGNYDVVITADGHATGVITAVPVISTGSVVDVSDSVVRITLPTSATHVASGTAVLNPASATAVTYVAAKQGTAPTVTVTYTATDNTSVPPGAYSLTLPVSAPLVGPYMTSFPITLTAQSAVAGQYTLEASATAYVTQSVGINVAASDVTQAFTLAP